MKLNSVGTSAKISKYVWRAFREYTYTAHQSDFTVPTEQPGDGHKRLYEGHPVGAGVIVLGGVTIVVVAVAFDTPIASLALICVGYGPRSLSRAGIGIGTRTGNSQKRLLKLEIDFNKPVPLARGRRHHR